MKVTSTSKWSEKHNKPSKIQWIMHTVFLIISIPLMFLGSLLLKISNFLMFDTHHMEIKIISK